MLVTLPLGVLMIDVSYTSVDEMIADIKSRLAPEVQSRSGVFYDIDSVIRAKRNEFGDPQNILYGEDHNVKAPIPSRPFIRPAIEGNKLIRAYLARMAHFFLSNIETADTDDLLVVLSEAVTDQIRLNILNKQSPRNADFTIEQKGFNDPLIDTGRMYDHVDWQPGG